MNILQGELIISFGDHSISGPQSQGWARIFSLMRQRHRIIHVLPHYYLRSGRPTLKERYKGSGIRMVGENLYEYQPPWYLPKQYRYPDLNSICDAFNATLIQRIIKGFGHKRPILYFWHPRYARMVGRFDEKLVCYHICDDYFGYHAAEPEEVRHLDYQLMSRSDLILTMSQKLERYARQHSSNVFMVPNGVDYELFRDASLAGLPEPADLGVIPKPRVGYTGAINAKVDFELIAFLAAQRPDWSFVLVGPVRISEEHIQCCRRLGNVHFLGTKNYPEVPTYVAGLDVCIIPNILKGWVLATYPQKLHEYLAAGKPVVSCDIEAMRHFEGVIRIARKREEWLEAIELSLHPSTEHEVNHRRQVAATNSWEQRVANIETLMLQALIKKNLVPDIKKVPMVHCIRGNETGS